MSLSLINAEQHYISLNLYHHHMVLGNSIFFSVTSHSFFANYEIHDPNRRVASLLVFCSFRSYGHDLPSAGSFAL